MTTTYLPTHPDYLDEADVRGELTRVFDICGGCRSCAELCDTFPMLFDLLDRRAAPGVPPDAGRLTPAEQDGVVDSCIQCKACVAQCPYTPGAHPWSVDIPRLVLRGRAMQHDAGIRSLRSRLLGQVAGRPALVAKLAAVLPGTAARIGGAPFVAPRFSKWFARRALGSTTERPLTVTLVPTCVVEYHEPSIGTEFIELADANGIGCSLSSARCCGAPWLHSGDIEHFAKTARKNVARLAAEVRRGTDIVVLDPTCRDVVRVGFVDHVGNGDADLVAAHTLDAADHAALVEQIRRGRTP